MNYPVPAPSPYMMYATKSESNAAFIFRVIAFFLGLICFINVISIPAYRIDLVSWFTGFTFNNRDTLNLFLAYVALLSLFASIAFKLYRALFWIVIVFIITAAWYGYGLAYSMNSNGPSFTETVSEKFNFDNIKSMSGTTIPANGESSTPINQLEPVTGTVTQGVTETVSPAKQRALSAHQKAVNIHTDRMKQKGYTWHQHLNQDEKDWCANKTARAAYRAKYNRATEAQRIKQRLKPEWLVEARCVTNLHWVK